MRPRWRKGVVLVRLTRNDAGAFPVIEPQGGSGGRCALSPYAVMGAEGA